MSKTVIRQTIDGVEKLLVVEVLEELDINKLNAEVATITEKIEEKDLKIASLKEEKTALIERLTELENLLQGQIEFEFDEIEPLKEQVEEIQEGTRQRPIFRGRAIR